MVTMHNWFECKIQYDKIGIDDGKQKKVTDTYLVDALSFTEAEARIIEVVRPYMTGEFTVSNVARARIHEIFESPTGDFWYRAKVFFVVLDQEKGTEKKIPSTMLIQADDVKEAIAKLEEGMKGTMSDYEIAMIKVTPILDVIPYNAPQGSNQESDGTEK
jgi:hypothetical protein